MKCDKDWSGQNCQIKPPELLYQLGGQKRLVFTPLLPKRGSKTVAHCGVPSFFAPLAPPFFDPPAATGLTPGTKWSDSFSPNIWGNFLSVWPLQTKANYLSRWNKTSEQWSNISQRIPLSVLVRRGGSRALSKHCLAFGKEEQFYGNGPNPLWNILFSGLSPDCASNISWDRRLTGYCDSRGFLRSSKLRTNGFRSFHFRQLITHVSRTSQCMVWIFNR